MKQTIILFAILFAVTNAKAQSGLQFSQALFVPVTFTTAGGTVALGTVPAGKVWKLEQVLDCGSFSLASYYFRFNGATSNAPIPYVVSTSSAAFFMNSQNIWWPAGTAISVYTSTTLANTLYFSILEFTVVP